METNLKINQTWKDVKTRLKQIYPNLTDMDLAYEIGKETELLRRLKLKLGKTSFEIIYIIERLQSEKNRSENSKQYCLIFENNTHSNLHYNSNMNFTSN